MKKLIKNQKGQITTEYLLITIAMIIGLGALGILSENFVPLYESYLDSIFYTIRMPF